MRRGGSGRRRVRGSAEEEMRAFRCWAQERGHSGTTLVIQAGRLAFRRSPQVFFSRFL